MSQPRQRHRIISTSSKGLRIANYTPAKAPVNVWKAAVQLAASEAYTGPLLEGPVALEVDFFFQRPQRLVWKKRPMSRAWHVAKPDLDNTIKAIKDSLKGIIWRDDAQVSQLAACKWYAAGDEKPRTVVRIRGL